MPIATMLTNPKHSVEAWMNLAGIYPRGDPGSYAFNTCKMQICASHVRHLCSECASFFKIGRDYDWEEQYDEYSAYWENYFQLRGRA